MNPQSEQSLPPILDSHCHLDDAKFDPDRDQVIQRAKASGVCAVVNIGTDNHSNAAAFKLSQSYPGYVYHTVGAHPEEADLFDEEHLAAVVSQARETHPLAIGEIGLDYFHHSDPNKQRHVFITMLELARELQKPVVIHNRDADEDMLTMLSEHAHGLKILLHSYLSGPEFVEKYLQLNCYFGIGGPLTFKGKRADPHRQAIKILPLERILLETDAPYLTPHPHRGKRNEPAYTRITAEKIAELKALDLAQVAQQTTRNSMEFFGI